MIAAWRRLPTLVRAVVVGALVASAGTLPWAALAGANLERSPAIPWSVAAMAPYLWLYWRFLDGNLGPRATAEARRASLRARALPGPVWRAALLAGALGWGGLVALRVAFDAWLELPRAPLPDASSLPTATVAVYVLMLSIVAGVAEEAGFRGYMQSGIERRHGPLVAIGVVSGVFWLAHATHYAGNLRVFLLHGWFYLGASALYGALAYWTASILPCIVLHAAGDVAGVALLAALANSEYAWDHRAQLWSAGAAAAVLLPAALLAARRLAQRAQAPGMHDRARAGG